jgi:OFA family oxalate/formate antiporter-like MFS transporter
MMTGLGAMYAWAAFVEPIKAATGIGQARAQWPFSVFYTVFPLTIMVAGLRPSRRPPHVRAVLGGLLYGGGWILAGLGDRNFLWTVLGAGVLGGVGVGLSYLVPVSVAMAWFPRNKGLVTGVAVSGFGGGAMAVSYLAESWMASGATPFRVLTGFGLVFMAVVAAAGAGMRIPAGAGNAPDSPLPARRVAVQPAFGALFATFSAGLACGLTVVANLKQLSATGAGAAGLSAVGWFAAANAAGRLLWGEAQDRWPPVRTLAINLVFSGALLPAGPVLCSSAIGQAVFAALIGFNYGGILSMHPALVARHWGRVHLPKIYGLLFVAHLPAALLPLLAGRVYERTGSFAPILTLCAAWALSAALALWWKRRALADAA